MLNENVAVEPKGFRETVTKSKTVVKIKTVSKAKVSKQVSGKPKISPPPYHLFTVLGDYFVFDMSAGQFYKVDELTHEFLKLCLTCSIKDAKKIILAKNTFSKQEVDSVAKEVLLLSKNGLLDIPEKYIDVRQLKRQIKKVDISDYLHGVELSLADDCNLACKYCYCSMCRETPPRGLMKKEVAKQAIDLIFSGENKEVDITFFGGEPLLNKPVIDFVIDYSQKLAANSGKKVNYIMTTNATLIDDKIVDYITQYNFGLMVSLDGPQKIHDAQCPTQSGTGSYEMAVNGIKKIMQRRKSVTVRATMTHPVPKIKELIDFFEDFGFTRIVIGPSYNLAEFTSPVDFTKEDFSELARQEESLLPWMLDNLKTGIPPKYFIYQQGYSSIEHGNLSVKSNLFKCSAARSNVGVGVDGSLFPCHRFEGMSVWKIGDVSSGLDFEKCKKFWIEYHRCISDKCGDCWAFPVCKGPCPWDIAQSNGSFKFSDRHCGYMKTYAERAAYLFFWTQEHIECKTLETLNKNIDVTNIEA